MRGSTPSGDYGNVNAMTTQREVKNMRQVTLVVGVPFSGRPVTPQWAVSFALQDFPLNIYRRLTNRVGMPVAEAREQMVDEAYSVGAKYLYLLDDDVQVPFKGIRQLIYQMEQHKMNDVAVTAGVYWKKGIPTEPVMFKQAGGGAYWNWKAGDLFTVDEIGAGCMLIDLEALREMPRPWFMFTESEQNGQTEGGVTRVMESKSEDLNFCQRVRDFGKRILVDSSVQCVHWDVATGEGYKAPEDSFPMRDERVARALTVTGFTNYKELVWLADAVRNKKLVVELGSYQGRSTRVLADNTMGKVIAFDSFTGIPQHPGDQQHLAIRDSFVKEFQRFMEMGHVVLVDGDHDTPQPAVDAMGGELADMVFIDGDHSYVGCKRDIDFWRQHMTPDGLLCGHDASWPGVTYALEELSKEAIIEFPEGTDLWYVKAWVRQGTEEQVDSQQRESEIKALEEMAK